jgi:hypothetical protein
VTRDRIRRQCASRAGERLVESTVIPVAAQVESCKSILNRCLSGSTSTRLELASIGRGTHRLYMYWQVLHMLFQPVSRMKEKKALWLVAGASHCHFATKRERLHDGDVWNPVSWSDRDFRYVLGTLPRVFTGDSFDDGWSKHDPLIRHEEVPANGTTILISPFSPGTPQKGFTALQFWVTMVMRYV